MHFGPKNFLLKRRLNPFEKKLGIDFDAIFASAIKKIGTKTFWQIKKIFEILKFLTKCNFWWSKKDEKIYIKFKKSAQIPGASSPLSFCSIIWGRDDLTSPFILNLKLGEWFSADFFGAFLKLWKHRKCLKIIKSYSFWKHKSRQ